MLPTGEPELLSLVWTLPPVCEKIISKLQKSTFFSSGRSDKEKEVFFVKRKEKFGNEKHSIKIANDL